jgi:hypothetical protein
MYLQRGFPDYNVYTEYNREGTKRAKAYGAIYKIIHHPGQGEYVYFINYSAFIY